METLEYKIKELSEITKEVSYWEDRWNDKYNEIISKVGKCSYCDTQHYPHCLSK